jgi:hypothetical protein
MFYKSYDRRQMEHWTFLTNHAHVLLCLAQDSEVRLRDVAEKVGITERAAQRIVADLQADGYITTERVGRRNHYIIHPDLPLRHPIEERSAVGTLISLLNSAPARRARRA